MMASSVIVKVQQQRLFVKIAKNTFYLSHVVLVFLFCVCLPSFLFLLVSFVQIIKALYTICHVLFVFVPIGGVLVVLLFVQPWPPLQKSCEHCLPLA
jgi:hypothetical protein